MTMPTNETEKYQEYMDKYSKDMKNRLTNEQLQKLAELRKVVEQAAHGAQKEAAFEEWVDEALQYTISAFNQAGAEKKSKSKKMDPDASEME